ncbi:MAG: SUMF1/EgtB/PvdO family nonheme iron enzyme [Armatimonadetes bacterium]|nr:SUMF1/EgtB/PvdO family nonheme iron enzyme [Armatimonadota bacterium]
MANWLPADWPADLAKWSTRMPRMQYRIRAKDRMPQALIPAGEFLMGSPEGQGIANEHPQRRVYVSAFWMDVHDVKVAQYKRFCGSAGKPMASYNPDDTHPVVNVSWEDADAYAKWAGGNLPTEAQWEKAARGGLEGMVYPWGNDWNPAKANRSRQGKKPVDSYAPNGYGLFDMAGNVWQWCLDCYDADWYATMPARDPCNKTQGTFHVLRGGSWTFDTAYLRAAYRAVDTPGSRNYTIGFRCAEAP